MEIIDPAAGHQQLSRPWAGPRAPRRAHRLSVRDPACLLPGSGSNAGRLGDAIARTWRPVFAICGARGPGPASGPLLRNPMITYNYSRLPRHSSFKQPIWSDIGKRRQHIAKSWDSLSICRRRMSGSLPQPVLICPRTWPGERPGEALVGPASDRRGRLARAVRPRRPPALSAPRRPPAPPGVAVGTTAGQLKLHCYVIDRSRSRGKAQQEKTGSSFLIDA
jgi:hypothetical protein